MRRSSVRNSKPIADGVIRTRLSGVAKKSKTSGRGRATSWVATSRWVDMGLRVYV